MDSNRIGYLAFRALAAIFRRMRPRSAARLARKVGRLVFRFQGRHLERIARHHQAIFQRPLEGAALRRFARRFYEHLALLVVEFLRMPLLTRESVTRVVDTTQLEALRPLLADGRGLLATSGHVGLWEWTGHVAALLGFPVHAIARPLDNPHLQAFVERTRSAGGQVVFAKWNVLWSLKKLLDRGAVVGINADQDTTHNQIFVPFGRRLAATSATIGQLHRATGAPVVVCTVHRRPDDVSYEFRVWRVVRRARTEDAEADARAVMAEVNEGFVEAIRSHPEQWLWTHRRWKTRPPDEEPSR